ncbi:MAG: caspase family protein [Bacteroidales bacterium]|nr:caspase family protein [Bacteroidales bacterium]
MKKLICCLCSIVALCGIALAQGNYSAPKSFHIVKQIVPPVLDVVDGSVQFIDEDKNGFINANEQCKIRLQVKNSGMGDGYGCVAKISSATGTTQGLTYSGKQLSVIKPNESIWVEIPISATMNTATGTVTFTVLIDEPNGFGTNALIQVGTRAFENPFVEVASYQVTGGNDGLLTKRAPFTLQVMVQNTGYGLAENVSVNITFPSKNSGVFCTSGNETQTFTTIPSGKKQIIEYQFIANNNYTATDLPITIQLSEKHGKFAKDETVNLKFGQTIGSNVVVNVKGHEEQKQAIEKGSFYSDVDVDIPVTFAKNDKTFVVVVGNENYKSVSPVPYALNDSRIFKEYCEKTLGVPSQNIHYAPDATLNNIRAEVKWLKDIMEVYSDAKIIFYYAGHGIPDEANHSAYLLPVDGYGTDVSTGYKLDLLYSELGKANQHVTVFLDACFSGAKREGDMLVAARGVAIKTKSGSPQGNMVVFSASQGDETATANDNERHGMFTYYLLKKLKETQGNVTYGILGDYIRDNVKKQTVVSGKLQTPTVTPSASIQSDWRMWKLK